MTDTEFFSSWGIVFGKRRPDVEIVGSPNRSAERFVAEDETGRLFIAEGFELNRKNRQKHQTCLLEFLAENGIPAAVWLRTSDGEPGINSMARFWQVRRFADADPLPRAELGNSELHADLWENILLRLKDISQNPRLPALPNDRFLFLQYLPRLKGYAKWKMPFLSDGIGEIERKLTPFFQVEETLPVMLAHGDFHPGNCLVKDGKASAVIDWEFAGMKCAGYDLALLTGCLGMDNPSWLTEGRAAAMRSRLLRNGYIPEEAARIFPELTASIRLGWLGEWINLNDRELAEREMRFIHLVLDRREELLRPYSME